MKFVRVGLILGLLSAVVAGVVGFSMHLQMNSLLHGSAPTEIQVPPGSNLKMVLEALHQEGWLANPRAAYWYARGMKLSTIRTGIYEISPTESIRDLLVKLNTGQIKMGSFTLQEGLNRWQVRDLLAEAQWIAPGTFDKLCDDQNFLEKYNIPGPSCEGYLFPETYIFARGISAQEIFSTLFATFGKKYQQATQTKNSPMQLNQREFVTLASIVEKETGVPQERPRIACVFYNRMRANPPWRLQTDPTVIYAATLEDPTFDGNIKTTHLRDLKNPYNTYTSDGLPPGPIASPGLAALQAVAMPLACRDFFFVSKNNGEHMFCPDIECHNQNVTKWQLRHARK